MSLNADLVRARCTEIEESLALASYHGLWQTGYDEWPGSATCWCICTGNSTTARSLKCFRTIWTTYGSSRPRSSSLPEC